MNWLWWVLIVIAVLIAILIIMNIYRIIMYNWKSGRARKARRKIDRSLADLDKQLGETFKDL